MKTNIYELIEEELSEDDENYDENNTTSKLFPKILYTSYEKFKDVVSL